MNKNLKYIFKVLVLILFFGFNSDFLLSQTTFNQELKVMNFISDPGPVLTFGDTILCLGHGTDFYSYKEYDLFLAKFDLEGNLIQRYIDTLGDYYFSRINDAFVVGGEIITFVDSYENPDFWGSYFIIIDIASGKITKKIKLTNPKNQFDYGSGAGLVQMDSVRYAAVSIIHEEEKVNGILYLDMQISIINIETEEVKYLQFGQKRKNEIPRFINWTGHRFLVGTYISTPTYNIRYPLKKRETRGYIYEIDTFGLWSAVYRTGKSRGSIRNLLKDKDGGYIGNSNYVKWYNVPNTEDYVWRVRNTVIKLDSNFNMIWEKPWGLNFEFNDTYGAFNLLNAEEGDGYILGGYQPNYPWTKSQGYYFLEKEVLDSLKEAGSPPMTVGILQKISEEGDSIWLRSYSVVSDTSFNYIEHKVHDVTYSPDGGYILYGYVFYPPRPEIDTAHNYRGWLLKVDKDGCLVPGCVDTIDTTNLVNVIEETQIMLYPNPTSDKLLVYQKEAGLRKYMITDISGKEIIKWVGNLQSHTYIIDVSRYNPGMYILTVRDDNGKQGASKFVVE